VRTVAGRRHRPKPSPRTGTRRGRPETDHPHAPTLRSILLRGQELRPRDQRSWPVVTGRRNTGATSSGRRDAALLDHPADHGRAAVRLVFGGAGVKGSLPKGVDYVDSSCRIFVRSWRRFGRLQTARARRGFLSAGWGTDSDSPRCRWRGGRTVLLGAPLADSCASTDHRADDRRSATWSASLPGRPATGRWVRGRRRRRSGRAEMVELRVRSR